MRRFGLFLAFFALIPMSLLFSFVSCTDVQKNASENKVQSQSPGVDFSKFGKPVILFDLAHREVFSPTDPGQRGLKQCVVNLERLGFKVVENTDPFSEATLKGAAAVFIPGAMQPLGENEIKALKEFVRGGGLLLITVHVNYFLQPLLDELGFQITSAPLCDSVNRFHENNKDFIAREIIEHPITEKVAEIAVMGAYGLKGKDERVKELVFTSSSAWVDLNGNDAKDTDEVEGRFCVVAASEIGKGNVVVIGDDAVFSNMLIESRGNNQLLSNIFEWAIGKQGEGAI